MKKIPIVALFLFAAFNFTSCKKGECTCNVLGSDITTSYKADSHDQYKQDKSNCETLGCKWTPKL